MQCTNKIGPPPVMERELIQLLQEDQLLNITNDCLVTYWRSALLNAETPDIRPDHCAEIFQEIGINVGDEFDSYVHVFNYYVRGWPVWKDAFKVQRHQHQYEKKLSKKVFKNVLHKLYLEFCTYLKYKIENVEKLRESLENEEAVTCKENSRENSLEKETAPYAISLSVAAKNLNTIYFETSNDDVVLNHHKGKSWKMPYNFKSFINMQNVSVQLKITGLNVTRKMCHEYHSFISTVDTPVTVTKPNKIQSIEKVPNKQGVEVYTIFYFMKYCEQLQDLVKENMHIKDAKKSEIIAVIHEILEDLREININNNYTFATNAIITYVIGGQRYVQSKATRERDVHFCEIITPRVEVAFKRMKAEQDLSTEHISFKTLNKIGMNYTLFQNCLTYSCTLCCKSYTNLDQTIEHFTSQHNEEQLVICWQCRNMVPTHHLAQNRWKHECQDPAMPSNTQ